MDVFYAGAVTIAILLAVGFLVWFFFRLFRKTGTKDVLFTPVQLLTVGCFLSICALFLPIYFHSYFEGESLSFVRGIKTFFLTIHNTLRVFILDGDFDIIRDAAEKLDSQGLSVVYTIFSAVMYVVAPFLTAGFVMSFFRGLNALIKYHTSCGAELFFISELTPDSYYLAKDILDNERADIEDVVKEKLAQAQAEKDEQEAAKVGLATATKAKRGKKKKHRKRLVVFFDVYEQNEEGNSELIGRVKELGAIYFRRDITELIPHKTSPVKYYFIGQNEDENMQQCLEVMENLKAAKRDNEDDVELYVFSSTVESELLLNKANEGTIKARRINENRNLIIDTLLHDPIFDHAIPTGKILPDGTEEKLLSILIVGLGRYGTELLKALTWSGQMLGHRLKIHVIDKDPACEKRFRMHCPETMLISDRIKELGHYIDGESEYEIFFHTGVDIDTIDFYDVLNDVGQVTSVYCTLGQDEINIETAVRLRTFYGRRHQADPTLNIPSINAVVYSTEKNEALAATSGESQVGEKQPSLTDSKGNDYGIRFVGSRRLRYTLNIIEQPVLERQALLCHLCWADTADDRIASIKDFNRVEYYRRSSLASAVHARLRKHLGYTFTNVEGLEGEELARTQARNHQLSILEHRRWNAFVRSEGYVAPDLTRNNEGEIVEIGPDGRPVFKQLAKSDMIKLHRCLIPFGELPLYEQDKDKSVIAYDNAIK